jgi:hypothetical protein
MTRTVTFVLCSSIAALSLFASTASADSPTQAAKPIQKDEATSAVPRLTGLRDFGLWYDWG